jgi:formamidopyrimidine-DNA glycosylase
MKTMPELPEVETVRTALEAVVTGQKVEKLHLRRPDLRWPFPAGLAERVAGQIMGRPQRRGKYILLPAGEAGSLLLHLGMSGAVRICEGQPDLGRHDHVLMQLASQRSWVFCDPRRFGHLDWVPAGEEARHWLLREMGVEPLSNRFSAALLQQLMAGRKSPIKTALLDQRLIAGLGNIYVSEALFRAGISPRRKAASIGPQRAQRLSSAIRQVLQEAIAQGGTSLRDHRQPNGEIGYFVQKLKVYGKKDAPCPACATPIRMLRQSGRSGFYCPSCQR